MSRYGNIIAFISLVALTACTTGKSVEPQLVASPDSVSLMLAEAAGKASTALETLAAVEQVRTPGAEVGSIPNVPPELRRAVTISWTGPAEPLVKKMADRAGYAFMTIGNPSPVPLVVSVDVENRPVMDIMRDVGLQMGSRADLKVDASRRLVEIRYAPLTSTSNPG